MNADFERLMKAAKHALDQSADEILKDRRWGRSAYLTYDPSGAVVRAVLTELKAAAVEREQNALSINGKQVGRYGGIFVDRFRQED